MQSVSGEWEDFANSVTWRLALGLGILRILGILGILSWRELVCKGPGADNKTELVVGQVRPVRHNRRQECTGVHDWRIERRKARSGKARSLRHKSTLISDTAIDDGGIHVEVVVKQYDIGEESGFKPSPVKKFQRHGGGK